MTTIRDILPILSQSVRDANPQLGLSQTGKTKPTQSSARRRGIMNATEADYSLGLEGMKRRGEMLRYEFEGFTLRWADMRYTPDVVVFSQQFKVLNPESSDDFIGPQIKLIEVKGAHIWDRDNCSVQRRSSLLAGVRF